MKTLTLLFLLSALATTAAWIPALDIIGFPHPALRVSPADEVTKPLEPIMDLDLVENDSSFSIHADLPGVSKDDVEVNIEEGILTISAHKENRHEENTDTVHYMERSYGMYQRSIRLPKNVKPASVSATVQDGVLEVTLPKEGSLPAAESVKVPVFSSELRK